MAGDRHSFSWWFMAKLNLIPFLSLLFIKNITFTFTLLCLSTNIGWQGLLRFSSLRPSPAQVFSFWECIKITKVKFKKYPVIARLQQRYTGSRIKHLLSDADWSCGNLLPHRKDVQQFLFLIILYARPCPCFRGLLPRHSLTRAPGSQWQRYFEIAMTGTFKSVVVKKKPLVRPVHEKDHWQWEPCRPHKR